MKTAVRVPTINANDDSVVVVRWHVPEGGRVESGAPIVDVETTKAVVALEAESGGWLRHGGREGDEIAVGGVIGWLFSDKASFDAAAAEPDTPKAVSHLASPASAATVPGDTAAGHSVTRLSPAAARLAAEKGVDPASLEAARLGLVTRATLEARLFPVSEAPVYRETHRAERVSPAKRAEIQALKEGVGDSLRSSLALYIDSAGTRAAAAAQGRAFLPVVLAELAGLLSEHPRFTAFHDQGSTVFYDAVHLGVAVDLGQGLRVVTLRDAAGKDAATLEARMAELTLDVMENNLALADAQGATFTVSDLSGFDIMHFEPLINGRQAAILALGGDATLPGHPMSLTLAFDHRVLTGREVAVFLQKLRDRILDRAISAPETEEASSTPSRAACCDRCLMDVPSYYEKFGPVGVMHQYTRPDGTTGLLCHACLASF